MPCPNVWSKKSPTWGKIQYYPWIKHEGYENKGNDHQLKKLMIVIQTLLVSVLGNVYKTVWRICILMLGRKEDMTERRREWSDLPIRSQTLASPGLKHKVLNQVVIIILTQSNPQSARSAQLQLIYKEICSSLRRELAFSSRSWKLKVNIQKSGTHECLLAVVPLAQVTAIHEMLWFLQIYIIQMYNNIFMKLIIY